MGMGRGTKRTRGSAVGTAFVGRGGGGDAGHPRDGEQPADPSAVRLHMATDGQYFAYGSQTQGLAQSGCKINSPAGSLIKLSAANGKDPGLCGRTASA